MIPAVRHIILRGGRAYDADTRLWRDAVLANGGTVSTARLNIVDTFIVAEKAAGLWALTDDYWAFWAENAIQALTSLKKRRLATAVNSPTFTANQGYTGDAATFYVRLGFIPSTMATAITSGKGRVEVYLRTNASGTMASLGVTSGSTMFIRPRTTTNFITSQIMAGIVAGTDSITDSRGLTGAERNNTTTISTDKNGVVLADVTAASPVATLPTNEFYLLANNNSGAANTFDSRQVGYASVGAPLVTSGLKSARYANVQAFATSVGANV